MTVIVAAVAVVTLTIGVITLRSALRLIDTLSDRIIVLETHRDRLLAKLAIVAAAETVDAAFAVEEAR